MKRPARSQKTALEILFDVSARYQRKLGLKICTHIDENGDPCKDCIDLAVDQRHAKNAVEESVVQGAD